MHAFWQSGGGQVWGDDDLHAARPSHAVFLPLRRKEARRCRILQPAGVRLDDRENLAVELPPQLAHGEKLPLSPGLWTICVPGGSLLYKNLLTRTSQAILYYTTALQSVRVSSIPPFTTSLPSLRSSPCAVPMPAPSVTRTPAGGRLGTALRKSQRQQQRPSRPALHR